MHRQKKEDIDTKSIIVILKYLKLKFCLNFTMKLETTSQLLRHFKVFFIELEAYVVEYMKNILSLRFIRLCQSKLLHATIRNKLLYLINSRELRVAKYCIEIKLEYIVLCKSLFIKCALSTISRKRYIKTMRLASRQRVERELLLNKWI